MTVGQLVYPARSFVHISHDAFLRATFPTLRREWSRNAELWRAIVIGFAFALIAMTMMALALGGAGHAAPHGVSQSTSPAVVQTAPAQRPAVYQGGL